MTRCGKPRSGGHQAKGTFPHGGAQGAERAQPRPGPVDLLDGRAGNSFQPELVPTLAMISGPWSLYDPVFGEGGDFGQMRKQVLAAGDTVPGSRRAARAEIAGEYPALQAELDAGTKTPCPETDVFPQRAPGPGSVTDSHLTESD